MIKEAKVGMLRIIYIGGVIRLFFLRMDGQEDKANNMANPSHGNLECWSRQGVWTQIGVKYLSPIVYDIFYVEIRFYF